MAHLITFTTAKFDPSQEEPNPVNPIAGQSVLAWLCEQLVGAGCECSEPRPEDWGWLMEVRASGALYLIGASGDSKSSSAEFEWIVQVDKSRSTKERLLARNKLTSDDPLVSLIEKLVRFEGSIEDIAVER